MNYDKAILIENFDYASPIHVCVTLICDVLFTQLYNHHTFDVSQRLITYVGTLNRKSLLKKEVDLARKNVRIGAGSETKSEMLLS